MKPTWIELVNTGVANRFDFGKYELIEMNWRLTDYPKLYRTIFEHEIKHDEGNYKSKDFLHDMGSRTPGLLKFMSNHISSWTQILPFYWSFKYKKLVYDYSAILSWLMMLGLCIGVFFFLRWLL